MGEDVRVSVQPGDVVAAKYRVERVIGRGGMGVVVAAAHVELGNRVALKFLLPNALGNKEAVARFEREARAAVALQSDHVSRVLDVGRMPDGAPYIVMELLDGMDLAHELHRRGGRLPLDEAVSYILQACDAISDAHALGIVHRDIKPSNLFLAKRGKKGSIIKVLDFGISKPTSATESPTALTGTADLIGSPLYMSPEQLRAPKTVDGRSDVWSLAATLYELVCGAPPFDGATMAELSANILTAPAPDVRKLAPSAPDGFSEVMTRAFEKDPSARFESVEDFARALAPFAATQGAPPLAPTSSPGLAPPRVNHTLPLLPAPGAPATPVTPVSNPRLVEPEPKAPDPKVASDVAVSFPPPPQPAFARSPLLIGGLLLALVGGIAFVATRKEEPKPAPLVASPPPSAPLPFASVDPLSVVASAPAPSAVPSVVASITPRTSARPASSPRPSSSSVPAPSASASAAPASSKPRGIGMDLQ